MPAPARSSLALIFRSLVLLHTVLLVAFWLSNRLFFNSTNDYLKNMLGRPMDYVSTLLVLYALLGAWTVYLIAARPRPRSWGRTAGIALHTLLSLLGVGIFYGSFWLLFKESPIQAARAAQLWMYYRALIDGLILLLLAVLGGLGYRRHTQARQLNGLPPCPRLAAALLVPYLLLWAVTLLFPPHNVYRGALPPKPLLVAHRGASMLAPENTLASAQLALDLGVYAYESDLRLSADGQLFLMHDDTFARTTDIQAIFPGREKERVEAFTLSEISQLNAGKWWVDRDPFRAIARGWATSAQVDDYSRQHVPLLSQALDLLRQSGAMFIFDLKTPPAGHPYAGQFFDLALEQIHQAGLDSQIWFLVSPAELQILHSRAPQMIPVAGANYKNLPGPEELAALGYQVVNVEYGLSRRAVRAYREAGLAVNVYTIDEPWQYSRLWLAGATSTTTNNLRALQALARPVMALPYWAFALAWTLLGAFGLSLGLAMVWPTVQQKPVPAGEAG